MQIQMGNQPLLEPLNLEKNEPNEHIAHNGKIQDFEEDSQANVLTYRPNDHAQYI